jgi:hypothetical protein
MRLPLFASALLLLADCASASHYVPADLPPPANPESATGGDRPDPSARLV